MNIEVMTDASIGDMTREMSRMANEGAQDPGIRQLVEQAFNGNPEPAVDIFIFIEETFPYLPDPENAELLIHPRKIAEDYLGGRTRAFDCDDYSMLTVAMMRNAGYQARLMIMDTNFDGYYDHAIAQVYSERLGEWVNADTSGDLLMGWYIQSRRNMVVQ